MKIIIHVLLFSAGLCLLIQSISCEYILIQEQKTWDEAQVYCRENYIDLATVQSNEDWRNVQDAVKLALTSSVWIGLYNDINNWRWSYQDEKLTFMGWRYDQPNNIGGIQECGAMEYGIMVDLECAGRYPVVCYNENNTGADKFVLINIAMNWKEAQSYCRQHYTDLTTIRSQTDDSQLKEKVKDILRVWIGLFRDSWQWSDGTNLSMSSINWMSSKGDISGTNRPCGAAGPDGLIDDRICSNSLPFICKQRSKKQILRLEVKSAQILDEPAVIETILQWLKQKLKDRGLEKDTRVTRRLQANGNVFIPNKVLRVDLKK